ncbi:MAG: hypothetical protein HY736_10490 [Verrucomicrobia bacterium]|nr:hypothetical protein [Verrucomicrobiota bacterium]
MTALCLSPLDMAGSKLVAGRDKDKEFVAEMLRHKLIEEQALEERIALFEQAEQRRIALQNLEIVRVRIGAGAIAAPHPQTTRPVTSVRIASRSDERPPAPGPRMGI